jgi:hypothetical protein
MSDIITLTADDGLLVIRSELVHTRAKLFVRPETRSMVAPYDALLTRWTLVQQGQLGAWDREDIADALVEVADENLDDRTGLIVEDLSHAFGKDHATYRRFMREDSKSTIVRMGLASEIERVKDWPDSLRTVEPVAGHADPLAGLLTEGRSALDERGRANGARADHRLTEILAYVDDVNGARRSTYYALGQYAVEHGLPASWPKRFFRTRTRRRRSSND